MKDEVSKLQEQVNEENIWGESIKYTEQKIIELGFVHNNVKGDTNYRTTSLPSYDNNEIPYESELVYPIIPYQRPNINKYIMIGFICIVCKDKEKFPKTDYEMPMISGITDGIYFVIILYNRKKMELKELSNNPIDVKYTKSSVTLTTVPYGNDNKRRSLMRRNRRVVPKVEILLFDADEIRELQTIAQQIYKAKRKEREQPPQISHNESKKYKNAFN